jgi:Tol biopolymer transport system component/tRNA A-37 threonylcarbamoyl transferase component Bud32
LIGKTLGEYRVLEMLGEGGMGEVYKARDTKLNRDVAIKVLPAGMSSDPDRRARFEREAQAVAALSHPNILAIHGFGETGGIAYAVMELLDGDTLRARLSSGPMPARKGIDVAVQIARGLAAAHERGIVHRDLKPENIFIVGDGQVKIFDFGLARQTAQPSAETRATVATEAGTVLGTVGYMAPEQVRGENTDHRTDLFSFGAVLYEMLSGTRAFARDTAAESMTAILREEPPDIAAPGAEVPPALDRIVRHCLEKNPRERFQSAKDVGFALEALSTSSVSVASGMVSSGPSRRPRGVALALGVAALAVAAFVAGRTTWKAPERILPRFEAKTFIPQAIFEARFAPDGKTIVYCAALEGHTPQLFLLRPDDPVPTGLGSTGMRLLSVSSKGELAVLTGAVFVNHRMFVGTLARMTMNGAPRPVLEDVREADWSPDGTELAIVRDIGGRSRLEYPPDTILYETSGYVSDIRVSPDGTRVAFMDHQLRYDDRGWVKVVDRSKRVTTIDGELSSEQGLVWAADGQSVLYSAYVQLANGIGEYLVSRGPVSGGRPTEELSSAGGLVVHDVAADGRLLATRSDSRLTLVARGPGESAERDMSWLSSSLNPELSADGRTVLFTDQAAGSDYGVALRQTDGSPIVRLGDGAADKLSPDGRWALALILSSGRAVLYPTGAGQSIPLEPGALARVDHGSFFPDSKSVLLCGPDKSGVSRCYQQGLSGGPQHAITPDNTSDGHVSPDGRTILARTADSRWSRFALGSASADPVPGLESNDTLIRWSADGRSVFVHRRSEVPAHVYEIDIASGRRTTTLTLAPPNLAGLMSIHSASLADDPRVYAYTYWRYVSTLYVVSR